VLKKGLEMTAKAFSDALKAFQDKGTGLFDEGSHHPYHGTAHCMGALELFDEMPLYPIKGMDEFRDVSKIPAWLEYDKCTAVRFESREKLKKFMPETLAQAARIPGVNPADVSILAIIIKRGHH
jgi:hypothetical protein